MARRPGAGDLARDAACGALGGIVGTYAMGVVSSALYKREPEHKRAIEERVRKEPPFMVLAQRILEQTGAGVTENRRALLGKALHWGYGIGWGALYAVAARRYPALGRGGGLLFGLGFSMVGDEVMNAMMGLSAPPKDFPIDAHVRGLVGHVAFIAAADGTLRALDATRS